jgi:hypothetical protein
MSDATSGRCRDCRWWDENAARRQAFGLCLMACSEGGVTDEPQTRMVALDPGDHWAWLETAPDFGCVAFEPLGHPSARVGEGALP